MDYGQLIQGLIGLFLITGLTLLSPIMTKKMRSDANGVFTMICLASIVLSILVYIDLYTLASVLFTVNSTKDILIINIPALIAGLLYSILFSRYHINRLNNYWEGY